MKDYDAVLQLIFISDGLLLVIVSQDVLFIGYIH